MVFIRELGECTNVSTVSIPNMSKKEDRGQRRQKPTLYMYIHVSSEGTLGNSWLKCAAPGSPNPDLISDQNMSFFTPVFKPRL